MSPSTGRARCAEARTTVPEVDAAIATKKRTAATLRTPASIESGSSTTSSATPTSGGSGSSAGKSASASGSPTSKNSGEQPSDSKEHWQKPRDVRQLASQANEIATMVLNKEIDLDQARTYSALIRAVGQMMSIEVTRARFLRTEPVLEFMEDEQ